jgi:hypothetical protein
MPGTQQGDTIMGWEYTARPRDEDAELRAQYERNGNRVLASKICRSEFGESAVWYAALAVHHDQAAMHEAAGRRYTIAAVVLIDRGGRPPCPWGTKHMDETAGPTESKCPANILKLLSPVAEIEAALGGRELEYARAWRARCGRVEPPYQPAKAEAGA